MAKFGKWIGGALGWAFGGPIGAVMGFVFGTIVDGMSNPEYALKETQPGDFTASVIILSAAIMKADGKVLKSELDFVKRFFIQNFGASATPKMMLYLREVVKREFDLSAICNQINSNMDYPSKLQLLHFLFGIAQADNKIDIREDNLLQLIANKLNILQADFISIRSMFFVKTDEVDNAYKVLEIDRSASIEEIKKAFRRKAAKYHPDKVSHLGEHFLKDATVKFQQVNEAYERIKKEKNF